MCGTLAEFYGWHWGYTAAGIGMLAALVIYLAGMRFLAPETRETKTALRQSASAGNRRSFLPLLGMAVVIIFRGAYEQESNTIALSTDIGIDRHVVGGWSIPLTWFQAFNPLLIFLLTPFLVSHRTRLGKRGREPSSLRKMITEAASVGASYMVIALVSAYSAAEHMRAGWLWLTCFFVLMTTGELFILHVGLSFFGRLAPKGFEATAIATWFFAGFAGNLPAGGRRLVVLVLTVCFLRGVNRPGIAGGHLF